MEDAVLDYGVRRYWMVRNWREVVGRVRDAVLEMFPEARVYVFGSVVEGRVTASSDIDVLIKIDDLNGLEARGKLLAEIKKAINFAPLFEFHLANEKEFEWYRRFVKKFREI